MPQKSGVEKRKKKLSQDKKYKKTKRNPDEEEDDSFVVEDLNSEDSEPALDETIIMEDDLITAQDQSAEQKLKENNNSLGENANKIESNSLSEELARGLIEFNDNFDDIKEKVLEIDKTKDKLVLIFNKIRKKNIIRKPFPDHDKDEIFKEKIEEIINDYAEKIKKIDNDTNYNTESLAKINQLYRDMKEFLHRDWKGLYDQIIVPVVEVSEIKKENKIVLHDLDDKDYHGSKGLTTENAEEIERAKKTEAEEGSRDKPGEESLSEEERIELVSLIGEKLSEVENDYDLLMKKFHDFREKNKDEIAYNKNIFKKTVDINEKKVSLIKIAKENIQLNQKLLNNLIDLDREIIDLIEADWDTELKEFKGEIEFSEKESFIIEKSKEIVNKFIKDSDTKFDWENFPKGRRDVALEIQAVAFLMREFKKRSLFIDKEETVAEFIIKNRK